MCVGRYEEQKKVKGCTTLSGNVAIFMKFMPRLVDLPVMA